MDLTSRFCWTLILTIVASETVVLSAAVNEIGGNNEIALDILPSELRLGDPCRSSYECLHHLHHSHCDWDTRTCACQPHHFQFNDTWCLPASLLGYACALDAQCQLKVKNSECGSNNLCQCKKNFMPLRKDKCLPPARVSEYCLNDRQCKMANRLSYCKYIIPKVYGKCHCPLGSVLTPDGNCLPRICVPWSWALCKQGKVGCTQTGSNEHSYSARALRQFNSRGASCTSKDHLDTLGGECEYDSDCLGAVFNSICKQSKCQCASGYKAHRNTCQLDTSAPAISEAKGKPGAIRPVSLGKPCLSSTQCQVRDPYSKCVEGRCECVRDSPTCSSSHTQCLNDTFQCMSGQCISWYFVCDGEKNCLDGTDEENCIPFHCPSEAFQCNDGTCLSRSAVCNGRWECPDGSDEARCYTGIPCDQHSFRCDNGQCMPLYVFCNAVVDCYDGSDESFAACERGEGCPDSSFRCTNDRCRSSAILCSGLDGCGDNSDEDRCQVCSCEKPE